MQKIFFLIGDLGNGGQEKQMFQLALMLKNEYDVSVVVWDFDSNHFYVNKLKSAGIRMIAITKSGYHNKLKNLRKLIISENPDLVQSFTFYLNFPLFITTLFTSTTPIGAIRSRLKLHLKDTGWWYGLLNSIFPFTKISNNWGYNKGFFLPLSLINRIHIVTNKLDIKNYNVTIPSLQSTVYTCSVGRLYPEKRIDLIIETISNLCKSGINIIHHHAGKGALHDQLKEQILRLNLQDHFFLTGETDDVNVFLGNHHFLIHASEYEGYPNVIMESMAAGKAIVTTRCGDTEYLIDDKQTGMLVDINDQKGLETACRWLIENKHYIRQMGEAARRKAEQLFDLEILKKEIKTIYKTCVA